MVGSDEAPSGPTSKTQERARKDRVSLEVFGGGSHTSAYLFSQTRTAWKDALRSTEPEFDSNRDLDSGLPQRESLEVFGSRTQESDTSVWNNAVALRNAFVKPDPEPHVSCSSRDDDISDWLAQSRGQQKASISSVRSLDYSGRDSIDSKDLTGEVGARRSSGSSVAPAAEQSWDEVLQFKEKEKLRVSDEVLSERAQQWGYGVVLKPSDNPDRGMGSAKSESQRISGLSWTTDRSSVAGKSSRTNSEASSNWSGFSSVIPGVSKDVKDALGSFQLAFVVCDAQNGDYPILYASAGFFSMTGYSAKEVVGRNCRFLQGQYTDANDVAKIREALTDGKIYSGKLLNYKKDGTPFWNLLTLSPIKDDEGKIIKYIGMQAEVSEASNSTDGNVANPDAFPISLKKFLEGEVRKSGEGWAELAMASKPSSAKVSLETNSGHTPSRPPRYSLTSSRASSSDASTIAPVSKALQVHNAKMKSEMSALRAGVPESLAEFDQGKSGSKRTSGLAKMLKNFRGKFALSKPKGEGNDEEEDVEADEDEQQQQQQSKVTVPRVSLSHAGMDSRRSRRNSSLSYRNSDTYERNTSLDVFEEERRPQLVRSTVDEADAPAGESRRPGVGYGRRSVQQSADGGASDQDRRERRHSLPSRPSARPALSFDGKAQFCIVHPTNS